MTYTVKEIFKTIQGEGFNTGRAAVFCRFSGCNLWSGLERDRAKAICKFCDTDFVGGEKHKTAKSIANQILKTWGSNAKRRMVVITGGEPALQYDRELYYELMDLDFRVAIETNGTIPLKAHADWIVVSPKAQTEIVTKRADELKLVFPQIGMTPDQAVKIVYARQKTLQPMDGPDHEANTRAAIEYVMHNPIWRLGIQMHKAIGVR